MELCRSRGDSSRCSRSDLYPVTGEQSSVGRLSSSQSQWQVGEQSLDATDRSHELNRDKMLKRPIYSLIAIPRINHFLPR